jgi:hypothetical protein
MPRLGQFTARALHGIGIGAEIGAVTNSFSYTWASTSITTLPSYGHITYGNGFYVLYPSASSVYYTSTNLTSWTSASNGALKTSSTTPGIFTNSNHWAVFFNTSTFFRSLYKSSDGVTWSLATATNQNANFTIISSGTSYLLQGNGASTSYRSDDGINWVTTTPPSSTYSNAYPITWVPGGNIVATNYSATTTNTVLYYSTNKGASWTASNTPAGMPTAGIPYWSGVQSVGTTAVALLGQGYNLIASSTNGGVTWSSSTFTTSTLIASLASNGNTVFQAPYPSTVTTKISYSEDGIVWKPVSTPAGFNFIDYANGKWLGHSSDDLKLYIGSFK